MVDIVRIQFEDLGLLIYQIVPYLFQYILFRLFFYKNIFEILHFGSLVRLGGLGSNKG